MKANSKLIPLHVGRGHKKCMYKSWEIGSLWFNSTRKLYLIKMLLLSLCLPSSWIFFFFFLDFLLAVNWTHPFIVRVEDSFSVSLREPYREKGEQDLLLRSHLPSQELQARTVGKQLDFLFCVWEAVDLKWLRKCENSMNVVCRVAEGLQLLQAFCFNLTCL